MARHSTVSSPALVLALCALTLLSADPVNSAPAGKANPSDEADPRQIYSAAAPAWLRAVGKLRVPGSVYEDGSRAHVQEDCSATLVTRLAGRRADTIITAWHCLANYHDLSKTITFTLLPGTVHSATREAYRLQDGGGMHADWAILRLRQPVGPELVGALLINPDRTAADRSISMAGYSRDEGKGDGGSQLTFDPACLVTAEAPAMTDSNCRAHKGASGGAVIQLSSGGIPYFSGVVSQGDGAGISTFVPVTAFSGALGQHLR